MPAIPALPTRLMVALICLLFQSACGGGGGDDDDEPAIPPTISNYTVNFTADQLLGGTAAPDTVTANASLSSSRGEDTTASGSITVSGASASAVTINLGYAGENGPVALTLDNGGGGTWNLPADTELDDDEYFRLQATGFYVLIQTAQGELRGQILPSGWGLAMIDMDASRVVPKATSSGSAKAGAAINPATGQIRTRITVTGISDVISAGIRNAISGARGNVVLALERDASNPDVWGSIDINDPNSGNRLGTTGLDYLVNGRLYFSIETMANMDGELRGQILDESTTVLDIELTDIEVVTSGSPVMSSATGVATVTWAEPVRRLAVAVNTDAQNIISVSVHEGAQGDIGPVVMSLMPDGTLPGNWFSPVAELTEEQADALRAGNFYVNVVTAANPEGELRGQIVEPAP